MDKIGKEIMQKGSPTLERVIKEFGEEYRLENGELNRDKMGKLIFGDKEARDRLNKICIPAIQWKAIKIMFMEFLKGTPLLIIDSPLLIETKLHESFFVSEVIVIYCTEQQQLERLMARDNINEEYAKNKIGAQLSIQEKLKYANYVIDNSKSKVETEENVKNLLKNQIYPKTSYYFKLRNLILLLILILIKILFF